MLQIDAPGLLDRNVVIEIVDADDTADDFADAVRGLLPYALTPAARASIMAALQAARSEVR